MLGLLRKLILCNLSSQKSKYRNLTRLLGFCPTRLSIYEQALRHNSVDEEVTQLKTKLNNERLEYLGDAVYDLIIAELLYKKFPFKGEGFLTEMRSKAVSRKRMAQIGLDIGLIEYMEFDQAIKRNKVALRGIAGNALEAIIGAVYLDRGFRKARWFVKRKIVVPHLDFNELKNTTENYKSLLNQYAQKQRKDLEFRVLEESDSNKLKLYTIGVYIDGDLITQAQAKSKKVAEQLASEKTWQQLGLD